MTQTRNPRLAAYPRLCNAAKMDMREIDLIIGGEGDAIAIDFSGIVWLWTPQPPAKASWHFMTITGDAAAAVRAQAGGRSGGWGSIKVRVTIGATLWNTSLFPHRGSGGFMLPLKADVRRKEGLSEGVLASGTIEI